MSNLKAAVKEAVREELADRIRGSTLPAPSSASPGWTETAITALKVWHGGSRGPLWAKLLTWAPLLLLTAYVLYSWNKSAKALEKSLNEVADLRLDKERKEFEALTASTVEEQARIAEEAAVVADKLQEKMVTAERLARQAANAEEAIGRLQNWDDVDSAWK